MYICITSKSNKVMTTSNFKLVSETEKAYKYIVGFKFNENSPSVVYGVNGEEKINTGYLVECWFPKSVISEDGNVADWFTKKVRQSFGKFNPIMGDVIY
jgi:hypothetical protein